MNSKYPDTENNTGVGVPDFQKGVGFCIVLTLIPFAAVYWELLPRTFGILLICIAGIAQILLQFHYFLGVDGSRKERWNLISLILTIIIMSIFIGCTLWVMYTLNYRMM